MIEQMPFIIFPLICICSDQTVSAVPTSSLDNTALSWMHAELPQ